MMKVLSFLSVALGLLAAFIAQADIAKVEALVVDDITGEPLGDVCMQANFAEDIGWRAWTESPVPDVDKKRTDSLGRCSLRGKTNCGVVDCFVLQRPKGYYTGDGWCHTYKSKNLFGVWQPDNLVATIRLQRVEHPIPLFVKRVELRDYKNGIDGFDGTNSVLRFDLMNGDWLPPYGNGKVADMTVSSHVKRTGTEKRFLPQEGKWGDLQFYDLIGKIELHETDCLLPEAVDPTSGIKIRLAEWNGTNLSVIRQMGKRKKISPAKDWYCERFNDRDPDRCYTFRIRTRRNDKGELVEAYYGKVYGDFEFEGDDKKGLIGVKFLYYLNPKSLDRNLEWDMKTNLCPTAGKHESRLP